MLKINCLSKDERESLSTQVEGFFPASKKIVTFKPQYNKLKRVLPSNCDREIWLLITCITRSIRYGNTKSYMSFDNKYYHTMCHEFNLKLIAASRLNKVITKLEEDGYLTKYCGFETGFLKWFNWWEVIEDYQYTAMCLGFQECTRPYAEYTIKRYLEDKKPVTTDKRSFTEEYIEWPKT